MNIDNIVLELVCYFPELNLVKI